MQRIIDCSSATPADKQTIAEYVCWMRPQVSKDGKLIVHSQLTAPQLLQELMDVLSEDAELVVS